MKLLPPLLALFALIPVQLQTAVQGARLLTPRTSALIDAVFEDHNDLRRPGYAVGVIEKGELVYGKGFGSANLDHAIPISTSSVFNVASLSKQFTAAATGLLILEGRVRLEDPVGRHVREFPERFDAVQLQHLIYMTSGLPEYYELRRPGGRDWAQDFFTVQDALAAVFAAPSLEFEPGTRWAYSNTNYQLLAEVVERVSEEPFSQFLQHEIFEPLGMNTTHVNDDLSRIVPGRATGYNPTQDGAYRQEARQSPHYGGSGVFTTVEDLAVWDRSLREGRLRGGALAELLLQTRTFDHDKSNDAFGLVWGEHRGRRTIWYEGGDHGFSSYMVRLPDEDVSVIVLSNLGTGRAADRARSVLNVLFQEP